jgi:hypothetical protein
VCASDEYLGKQIDMCPCFIKHIKYQELDHTAIKYFKVNFISCLVMYLSAFVKKKKKKEIQFDFFFFTFVWHCSKYLSHDFNLFSVKLNRLYCQFPYIAILNNFRLWSHQIEKIWRNIKSSPFIFRRNCAHNSL